MNRHWHARTTCLALIIGGFGFAFPSHAWPQSAPAFGAPSSYQVVEPDGLGSADVDGDGFLDVVVANLGGIVGVLRGVGAGVLASPEYQYGLQPVYELALADLSGDLKPELVTANYSNAHVVTVLPNVGGAFGSPAMFSVGTFSSMAVATADFDGDGLRDVAVAGGSTLALLRNLGGNSFSSPTPYTVGVSPESIATGDFNGDGTVDLVTANSNPFNLTVFLGAGDGTLANHAWVGVYNYPHCVVAVDVSGDGVLDLIVSSVVGNKLSMLKGIGNGDFVDPVTYPVGPFPYSVVVGDLNLDGELDLASADTGSDNVSVLAGKGSGTFGAPVAHPSGGDGPYSAALDDLNNDGLPDLIIGNVYSFTLTTLLNTTAPPPPPTWADLAHGLGGAVGTPALVGTGSLIQSTPVGLTLSSAAPFASSWLVIGMSQIGVPFKGGVMVPYPTLMFALTTDFFGKSSFGGLWPPGAPSGFTTYFQWWIQDPAGPKGFAASNAVAGTAP